MLGATSNSALNLSGSPSLKCTSLTLGRPMTCSSSSLTRWSKYLGSRFSSTSSRTWWANLARIRLAGAFPGRKPGNLTFCWIVATTRSVSRVISSTGTVISISCLQPSTSIEVGGSKRVHHQPQPPSAGFLSSFVPACQVVFLFLRQAIDFDTHGFQLHARHLLVQILRDRVNAFFESRMVLHHVLGRQRLIREAHVH